MKIKSIAVALVAMSIYSCGTSKSTTPDVVAAAPVVASADAAAGKSLYESNCAKCHKLYEPSAYTAEKWQGILKWMQPKAQITDEQRTTIYNYLVMNK